MATTDKHYYWLDAIRFIAAFMVLLSHTRNDFFCEYGNLPADQQGLPAFVFYLIGRLGHEAVIVFFVLSGFLVGGKTLDRIREGNFDVRFYAINRFSRIYPPLIISILFYYITCLFVKNEIWNWGTAVGNILNLQGIVCESLVNPFWSLSYEWWFYIVLAAIGFSIVAEKWVYKMVGFLLICISISVFLVGEMTIFYLSIWFLGALAYLLRPNNYSRSVFFLSLFGIVSGIALYQLSTDTRAFTFPIELNNTTLIELYMSFMTCLLIQQVILIKPSSKFSAWVEKSLGYMGNFSYTLYLAHRIICMWIFYYVFQKHGGDFTILNLLMYLFVVIICLFGCWLLYLVSEKHTPTLKRKLAQLICH